MWGSIQVLHLEPVVPDLRDLPWQEGSPQGELRKLPFLADSRTRRWMIDFPFPGEGIQVREAVATLNNISPNSHRIALKRVTNSSLAL